MDTIKKLEVDLNRCRTEREVRDYYRSLNRGDQDMDLVINECHNRLLEIRRREAKKDDLLGRN